MEVNTSNGSKSKCYLFIHVLYNPISLLLALKHLALSPAILGTYWYHLLVSSRDFPKLVDFDFIPSTCMFSSFAQSTLNLWKKHLTLIQVPVHTSIA